MFERICTITLTCLTFFIIGAASARAEPRMVESFGDSATSPVDYRAAPYVPQNTCVQMMRNTNFEYSVMSVENVATSKDAPAHCRVHGLIQPEIQFWVFLPETWNGRFYMHGHGGYAGKSPLELAYHLKKVNNALAHNFAVAYTDTGHDYDAEPEGEFALNDTAKTVDYAYRSVHLTARVSKQILSEYYGQRESYSYWDGCSTGGRQGLMEAQRFPEDFDGVLAGAPVNAFTDLHIWMAWVFQKLEGNAISLDKIENLLAPAVYELCDDRDGLKDGLIQDPASCPFKPAEHLPVCSSRFSRQDCFTKKEIDLLEHLYSPVMRKGAVFYPGMQVGAEAKGVQNFRPGNPVKSGWYGYLLGDEGALGRMNIFVTTFFRYLAFERDDPDYDWRNLDFNEDLDRMDHIRIILDAVNTDMSAFRDAGGKIISYHGGADIGPPASFTTDYYNKVLADMGMENTQSFYRLFMVPGMFHCGGGFGTDYFDAMTPLINWVERGVAPDQIRAEQRANGKPEGAVERTRPLCPYPQHARYNGEGDPNAAENFTCVMGN